MPGMATARKHAKPVERPVRLVDPHLPGATWANAITLTAEKRAGQATAGAMGLGIVLALGALGAGGLGLGLVIAIASCLAALWALPRVAHTYARTRHACARTRASASTWARDARTQTVRAATAEAMRRNGPVRQANVELRRIAAALDRDGVKFPKGMRITEVAMLPPGRRFTIVRSGLPCIGLEKHEASFASGWHAASATVTVGAGRSRADMAWVQLHERNPLDQLPERMPWPAMPEPHSVLAPLPLGRRADGSIATLDIRPGSHMLVAGTTGGGKDNTCGLEVAWCAYAHDCDLYLVDMKGGLDWSRWRHACVAFGTDDNTARLVLSAFIAEMRRREAALVALGLSKVTIGPEDGTPGRYPLMKLVVSEVLELDAKCWAQLGQIVRLSRAMGGSVTLNTQEPRMDAMPDKTVRSNLAVRIALPSREQKHYMMILGRDVTDYERAALSRPGRGVLSAPKRDEALQFFWIGDGDHVGDPVVRLARNAPTAVRNAFGTHDRNPNPEQVTHALSELSGEPGTPPTNIVMPACIGTGGKGAQVYRALTRHPRSNTRTLAAEASVDWGTAKKWLDLMADEGAIVGEVIGRETLWSPRYQGDDDLVGYGVKDGEQEEGPDA